MSTLKTHNLQSPDAGSVNIALTAKAGMIVTGISTFNERVNVGSLGVTTNFTVAGLSTFQNNVKLNDSVLLQFGTGESEPMATNKHFHIKHGLTVGSGEATAIPGGGIGPATREVITNTGQLVDVGALGSLTTTNKTN